MQLTRRRVIAGTALLAAAGMASDDPQTVATTSPRPARQRRYRPVAGGVMITLEAADTYGTVAGGVEGPNGETWAVTNRHVVDPNYPDSDAADVIGTPVYQPDGDTESGPFGEVVDVGDSKGTSATDWAVIDVTDDWTTHVLGLGNPPGTANVAPGDRVVMAGTTTGLIGAEVTNTGIDRNWKGTLLEGVIEYRVDDDANTAGNSGSWVGTVDPDTGDFRPAGLHTFADGDYRYAVPASDVFDSTNATLPGTGNKPPAADTARYVEGAIAGYTDTATTAVVTNVGDSAADSRTITLRNSSGDVVDERTITLDPLEVRVLDLEPADRPKLSTGDETTEATQP